MMQQHLLILLKKLWQLGDGGQLCGGTIVKQAVVEYAMRSINV